MGNQAVKILREAWNLLKDHWRALLAVNLLYFGLVVAGMILITGNRGLQQMLLDSIQTGLTQGPLSTVARAYESGNVFTAVLLTFAVNFFVATVLQITLPSLVVPFSGFLLGILRAVMWGFIFSPNLSQLSGQGIAAGALAGLLILLEGEGYVLGLFGSYLHGKAFLWPGSVGAATNREGYKVGFRQMLLVHIWIALVLLIAAIYEVIIVVYAMPGLR
jgi:hypothetical protein